MFALSIFMVWFVVFFLSSLYFAASRFQLIYFWCHMSGFACAQHKHTHTYTHATLFSKPNTTHFHVEKIDQTQIQFTLKSINWCISIQVSEWVSVPKRIVINGNLCNYWMNGKNIIKINDTIHAFINIIDCYGIPRWRYILDILLPIVMSNAMWWRATMIPYTRLAMNS